MSAKRFFSALNVLGFSFASLLFQIDAHAGPGGAPECMDGDHSIAINNAQVIQWKTSTPNQFKARAYVEGTFVRMTEDRPTHWQFEIKIGNGPTDTLEVIYNKEFGEVPEMQIGSQVTACGDYITANEQAGYYPPSPSGAIIHWVHMNPRNAGHEHGFMVINGTLVGYSPQAPQERRVPLLEWFTNPSWVSDPAFAR